MGCDERLDRMVAFTRRQQMPGAIIWHTHDKRERLLRGTCPAGHEVVTSDKMLCDSGLHKLTCRECEKQQEESSGFVKMVTEMSNLFEAVRKASANDAVRQLKWDRRFLALAKFVASWSKDPSTQTGAIIVDNELQVVSLGYNGFARGVHDEHERYADRDIKYKLIVHCERNAILFADRYRLKGATLYTWPFPSCSVCAGFVIQAGIKRCVAPPIPPDKAARWEEDIKLASMQFEEAGVELLILSDEEVA